jgi:hypothetical protein
MRQSRICIQQSAVSCEIDYMTLFEKISISTNERIVIEVEADIQREL